MSLFTINEEKCRKDGLCVAECPARIIEQMDRESVPQSTADAMDRCILCGHCVAVCPHEAFCHRDIEPQECLPFKKDLEISAEQAEQFLRSRRSMRSFKDKPVEREKLEQLVTMAGYAPSAANAQPCHWLIVEDSAELQRMIGMIIEWMQGEMRTNPQEAEERGFPRLIDAWQNGQERICRGAPQLIIAHGDRDWAWGAHDGSLVLAYLELYAPYLGLGTCWGGYFYSAINACRPLFDELELPPGHAPYGVVMVGYPQYRYKRMPPRIPARISWR